MKLLGLVLIYFGILAINVAVYYLSDTMTAPIFTWIMSAVYLSFRVSREWNEPLAEAVCRGCMKHSSEKYWIEYVLEYGNGLCPECIAILGKRRVYQRTIERLNK
jgi:hypothetical protein